jgi:hypothetical protein
MNYTHGGMPESAAWSWTLENQRKLGQIVADLEIKEKAYKAWYAYYALKRYFMVETWTKFICDLTDFRKQNGFRGINELLEEANPNIQLPKECAMKEGMQSEALSRIAQALAQLSEGITSLLGGAPVETPKAPGKVAKVEKVEKPAEPAVDFVKLRLECKEIILDQVKNKGKDRIVAILAGFKATKLPEVKDTDLPALKAALDKEKAVEPEAVA